LAQSNHAWQSINHGVIMGVASNRQEEAIASSWNLLNKNYEADQLCTLQKTKRRQTGI